MRKIMLGLMVVFGFVITVSNISIILFLCKNTKLVNVDKIIEGSIVTSGLSIISLAITVWIGISIYNAIEKDEMTKLKSTIEKYSPVSEQVKRYTKQQFINQIYKLGDISCDYIAKKFERDEEIPVERYIDLLTIDILLQRVSEAEKDYSKNNKIQWCKTGIKKIDRYKGRYSKRYNLESFYLDYREADFYFYLAGEYDGDLSYKDYEKAAELYLKIATKYNILTPISEGKMPDTTDIDVRKLTIYFANSIAQSRAMMLKGKNVTKERREEMEEIAYKFFQYAILNAKGYCERETYYRNYGCFIENANDTIGGKEKAYSQYVKGFCIDNKKRKTYYVIVSNLNKRIREMAGIEMRKPNDSRRIPLPEMTFANVDNRASIIYLINEMKRYLDIAIRLFPDYAEWYAFSVYRKIYDLCLRELMDSSKIRQYLESMDIDVGRIKLLSKNTALCTVAQDDVADLKTYYKIGSIK